MNKIGYIARYEIMATLSRRSFLFTAFGIPLIALFAFVVFAMIKGREAGDGSQPKKPSREEQKLQKEGFVDRSGLIKQIYENVPEGYLKSFPDEPSALEAMKKGEISAYYIIPEKIVETGELLYVNPDYSLTKGKGQSWIMRLTITFNLLNNDPELFERYRNPMNLKVTSLETSKKEQPRSISGATFYVPYVASLITLMVILMSSSLLLHAISSEKKTRVMEILLVSVSPLQMLTGKIVGLGLMGLLQAVVWFGTAFLLFQVGIANVAIVTGLSVPRSMFLWSFIYFLLGYAIYATFMATLGALAPDFKEANKYVIIVIFPLLFPLWIIHLMIQYPNGFLSTTVSIFPLTSPVGMVLRLASTDVPIWQLLLSVVLLMGTAIFVVRSGARLFRTNILLSGQPFSIRRYFAALFGNI